MFLRLLAEDTHASFVVRLKDAANSTTNPEFTFDLCVKDVPAGGEWNSLHEATISGNIDGQISIDFDSDGTVTI